MPERDPNRPHPEQINLKSLSPSDFEKRRPHESDPENYETIVLPSVLGHATDPKLIIENYSHLISGFIDLRNISKTNPDNGVLCKSIVWISNDHMCIATNNIPGKTFPNDPGLRHYLIGIKINYDHFRRKFIIDRDSIGQICERTEEHVAEIIRVAEDVCNRDLIKNNQPLRQYFFLEDCGLAHRKDLHDKNIYYKKKEIPLSEQEHRPLDIIVLDQINNDTLESSGWENNLFGEIETYISKYQKNDGLYFPHFVRHQPCYLDCSCLLS